VSRTKWILASLAVPALIAGIWGMTVLLSDVVGQGEAVKNKNNAINRTQAQASFQNQYNSIKALVKKQEDAKVQLDEWHRQHKNYGGNGSPYDPLAEQEAQLQSAYVGAQQQCRNAVASYNADAKTYTLKDFRDIDLPAEVGDDPETDCGQR